MTLCAFFLAACSDARRLQPEHAVETHTPAIEGPGGSPEILQTRLADLICHLYREWPLEALDNDLALEVDATVHRLTETQRGEIEQAPSGPVAAQHCPEIIAPSSVPATGRLPVPTGRLPRIPGLYEPDGTRDPGEEQARYEWTAIGLGCLGLRSDSGGEELRLHERRFLDSMGFTLDSYIEMSLAMDDPALSDRIFRRILRCAR